MGHEALDGLHPPHQPEHPLARAQDRGLDRQFPNGGVLALAHRARHPRPALEPRSAQDSRRVALFRANLRLSKGTPVGAPIHQSAQTEGRKPVVGSRPKVSSSLSSSAVSPKDGYRLVSRVYDAEPNPILSLEQRFLERLFPPIKELDVVDLGCGTGRWLTKLAEKAPRSLLGVDFSAEMLLQAKRKLGSTARLVLADCLDIPLPRASADLILCSFVTSYLEKIGR